MLNVSDRIDYDVHLSFKDILLVPFDDDYCRIPSRTSPLLYSTIAPDRVIEIPLISSPMDSITGASMAVAMNNCGAASVYTRHINDPDELDIQVKIVSHIKRFSKKGFASCAIGVKTRDDRSIYDHVLRLCDNGLDVICLDIANGNHIFMHDAIKSISKLKDKFNLSIMAGNVATGKAALRLVDAGADSIRVGIGSGAICTTRRIVGFGVPQLTAIMDVAETLNKARVTASIISDGGIRNSGDVCKALWAGADAVMSGYIFSGHDECPKFDGKFMYRGMSSRTVSCRNDVAPEGVCFEVESKGPVEKTVQDYAAAIRAACSMANANSLSEFRKNVRAIRVSTVSNEESDPVRMD